MNALAEPLGRVLDRAPPSWAPIVRAWRTSEAARRLESFVDARRAQGATVYPADVLRALELTRREQVRVVIVGQDPYHGPGQADGLAFSVPQGARLPPSLVNILGELQRDLGVPLPQHGQLDAWARRGVLLLNTSLTVEDGRAGAHAKRGWEALTDAIIETVDRDDRPKVFMLWGALAQSKAPLTGARHCVLAANHPSPLSARRKPVPFVGCGHFGLANRFFVAVGQPAMDWSLD